MIEKSTTMFFNIFTMSRTSLNTQYFNLYSYSKYVFLLHKAVLYFKVIFHCKLCTALISSYTNGLSTFGTNHSRKTFNIWCNAANAAILVLTQPSSWLISSLLNILFPSRNWTISGKQDTDVPNCHVNVAVQDLAQNKITRSIPVNSSFMRPKQCLE